MSVEHVSDDQLQRHFDGELEPAEQAPARDHIAGCPDCSARLRGLEQMQRLLRMTAEDAAGSVNFAGMFERIEAAAALPEAPVVRPAASHKPAAAKAQQRWWQRTSTMSAAGAVAVAAAVLLMVFQTDPEQPQLQGETGDPTGDARSEITHVDFGENAGTVFEIALADGSSTPVVWINDDEDDLEGEEF